MSERRSKEVETALEAEVEGLRELGFSQEQFKALANVFSLAKDHPAFDERTARVILERIERRFAAVRDRVLEQNRRSDDEA